MCARFTLWPGTGPARLRGVEDLEDVLETDTDPERLGVADDDGAAPVVAVF